MGTWKYQKGKYVQINLKFHKDIDSDIIDFLDHTENVQGMIKYLIRSCIESRC